MITARSTKRRPVQHLLLRAIDFYQVGRQDRPSPCRFTPSCSEYSREAVETFGAGRGTWLTIRRLVRCRPFGPSGYDPIPERPIPEQLARELTPRQSPASTVTSNPLSSSDSIGRSH